MRNDPPSHPEFPRVLDVVIHGNVLRVFQPEAECRLIYLLESLLSGELGGSRGDCGLSIIAQSSSPQSHRDP